MDSRQGEALRLLKAESGLDENLLPLVSEELRGSARQRLTRACANHTPQATALEHEAYARLVGDQDMDWQDRGHFYSATAEAMRRVLIDHARRVASQERGADRMRVSLGAPESPMEFEPDRHLALDAALSRLAGVHPRAAEVTRLRCLAGLTVGRGHRCSGARSAVWPASGPSRERAWPTCSPMGDAPRSRSSNR